MKLPASCCTRGVGFHLELGGGESFPPCPLVDETLRGVCPDDLLLVIYDVLQVMQQFPLSFEFNERFLHTLFVHSYYSVYGKPTFTLLRS